MELPRDHRVELSCKRGDANEATQDVFEYIAEFTNRFESKRVAWKNKWSAGGPLQIKKLRQPKQSLTKKELESKEYFIPQKHSQ